LEVELYNLAIAITVIEEDNVFHHSMVMRLQ